MPFSPLLLLFSPLLGLLALLFVPSRSLRALKLCANAASAVPLVLCVLLLTQFPHAQSVHPPLGIDGYSLLLLLVTTALIFLAGLSSWHTIQTREKEYYLSLLALEAGLLGTFLALNVLLLFLFWEAVLISMYFLIAQRSAKARFLRYTGVGSVALLLTGMALAFEHFRQTGSYSLDLADLLRTPLPVHLQWWTFAGLFVGFAIQVPMVPFQSWLLRAQVAVPTGVSVLLVSILLNMGAYGFLRFAWPLTPDVVRSPGVVLLFATLSLVAILYGALRGLFQKDWRARLAYCSFSQMGYVTLGMIALTPLGLQGSMLEQVNHALSTALLLFLAGFVYERRGTGEITAYSGLFRIMPRFTICFLFAVLSSLGMPAFGGFISRFAILQGAAERNFAWAAWASLGLALGAACLLWLFHRTALGETLESNIGMPDLNRRELAICLPLVLAIIGIGLYPQPLFDLVAEPARQILLRPHP